MGLMKDGQWFIEGNASSAKNHTPLFIRKNECGVAKTWVLIASDVHEVKCRMFHNDNQSNFCSKSIEMKSFEKA
jgi:hypothetical protein